MQCTVFRGSQPTAIPPPTTPTPFPFTKALHAWQQFDFCCHFAIQTAAANVPAPTPLGYTQTGGLPTVRHGSYPKVGAVPHAG